MKVKDGDGSEKYIETVGMGTSGSPHRTIPADPLLEISRGNIIGLSKVIKFGGVNGIAPDTRSDVWDLAGTYPFPTSAVITRLRTDTSDEVVMRGLLVEVQGLDSGWNLVVQTKALSLTNTLTDLVELDTPLIRLFRMKVLGNVVGTDSIVAMNSGNTVGYGGMLTGNNQTLMAIYTVPLGKTAYITKYYASITQSSGKEPKSSKFGLWSADRANGYEFQLKHSLSVAQGGAAIEHNFKPYTGGFSEKTDIKITAQPLGESGDVTAGFDIILVDN